MHEHGEGCTCKHEPTNLEIHLASTKGYYLRDVKKGVRFWALSGDLIIEHLLEHYPGSMATVFCDFEAGAYGRVQGSFEEPLTLEWEIQG